MKPWIVLLGLLAVSCAAVPPGEVASAPRTASEPRIAPTSPAPSSTLAIVTGADGGLQLMSAASQTLASAPVSAAPFRPNTVMSRTSASRARVYYLSAGFEIRYLAPDGSTGLVHSLTVHQSEEAGFSVSPDDKQIAVAVFSYDPAATPPTYKGMRLYVEDLQGGGHHVDIFSSPTVAEFPIGWVGGHLVLAVTTPICCKGVVYNPYGASEIHVADATTGNRLATLCGGSHFPEGPVETFGVMCSELGAQFWNWDGTELPKPAAIPLPSDHLNAVSPDGQRVAFDQQGLLYIWGPEGRDLRYTIPAYVYGWLDAVHIVIRREAEQSLSVFDLQTGSPTALPGATTYLGVFPAALS